MMASEAAARDDQGGHKLFTPLDSDRGHLLLMGSFDMLHSLSPISLEHQFSYDYGAADERKSLGDRARNGGGLSLAALVVSDADALPAVDDDDHLLWSEWDRPEEPLPKAGSRLPPPYLPPVTLLASRRKLPTSFSLHKDIFQDPTAEGEQRHCVVSSSPLHVTERPDRPHSKACWGYITKRAVATSSDGTENAPWGSGRGVENSPWNARPLVAIGEDRQLSLWDPRTVRMVHVVGRAGVHNKVPAIKFVLTRAHAMRVYFCAGLGDELLRMLDLQKTKAALSCPATLPGATVAFAYDPTKETLAAVTSVSQCLVVDLRTGSNVYDFRLPAAGLSALAMPDKNLLCCGMTQRLAAFDLRMISGDKTEVSRSVFHSDIEDSPTTYVYQIVRSAVDGCVAACDKHLLQFNSVGKVKKTEHVVPGPISDMVCLPPEVISNVVAVFGSREDVSERLQFLLGYSSHGGGIRVILRPTTLIVPFPGFIVVGRYESRSE